MKWKEENSCLSDETLQYYIDGELSRNKQKIIEKHLSECEHCQAKMQEKKNLIDLLSYEIPTVNDDEIFVPDFHPLKIEKPVNLKKTKMYWWSAAAVLLLLLSVKIFHNSEDESFDVKYVYQEMSTEIDANKSWYEQSTTLYILDESGEIIDKIENL